MGVKCSRTETSIHIVYDNGSEEWYRWYPTGTEARGLSVPAHLSFLFSEKRPFVLNVQQQPGKLPGYIVEVPPSTHAACAARMRELWDRLSQAQEFTNANGVADWR